MGLAEFQKVQARLYTDEEFRVGFLADPEGMAPRLRLTKEEASQLVANAPETALFARSLVSKRLNEVKSLLPMTARAFEVEFGGLFRRYAAKTAIPNGTHKHRRDAVAFVDWMIGEYRRTPDAPYWSGWKCELARFEQSWLLMNGTGRPLLFRIFACDADRLWGTLRRGEGFPLMAHRRTLFLWYRLPRRPARLLKLSR